MAGASRTASGTIRIPTLDAGTVTVRLRNAEGGVVDMLEVETPMGCDVLRDVEAALFALRIQVIRTHTQATNNRLMRVLELGDPGGARIGPGRRRQIEEVVADELGATAPRFRGLRRRPMRETG